MLHFDGHPAGDVMLHDLGCVCLVCFRPAASHSAERSSGAGLQLGGVQTQMQTMQVEPDADTRTGTAESARREKAAHGLHLSELQRHRKEVGKRYVLWVCFNWRKIWPIWLKYHNFIFPFILILIFGPRTTKPVVFHSCMNVFDLLNTKEDILKNLGKQSSSGAPLTSIVFYFLLWKSMVPQNSLVTNFLQNIFLCVQQNKDIQTGLELLEGE